MMRSAIVIASAMVDSKNGEGRPSQFASFRAARMLAAIRRTRFRPSSTKISLPYSPFVRHRAKADDFGAVGNLYARRMKDALSQPGNLSLDTQRDREFVDFIRREDLNVLPAVEALFLAQAQRAAARSLGMTEAQFNRTHNRLLHLGRCFLSGEPVPRQKEALQKASEGRSSSQPCYCGLTEH